MKVTPVKTDQVPINRKTKVGFLFIQNMHLNEHQRYWDWVPISFVAKYSQPSLI